MLAAATQERCGGFGIRCVFNTAMNSAYAPYQEIVQSAGGQTLLSISKWSKNIILTPAASPKTSSSTFHWVTSEPTSATWPENSTPSMVEAPFGKGYPPLRCRISIRFRPNAFTYRKYVRSQNLVSRSCRRAFDE